MMTLEQVREALADRNLAEVSRRTGISYFKIWRIMNTQGEPSYQTVEALSAYLEGVAAQ
jgi:DNA-binding phage protein